MEEVDTQVQISLRLPRQLDREAELTAARLDVSKTSIIIDGLRAQLKRLSNKEGR